MVPGTAENIAHSVVVPWKVDGMSAVEGTIDFGREKHVVNIAHTT